MEVDEEPDGGQGDAIDSGTNSPIKQTKLKRQSLK
jgi:hypothetical protein